MNNLGKSCGINSVTYFCPALYLYCALPKTFFPLYRHDDNRLYHTPLYNIGFITARNSEFLYLCGEGS